MAIGDINDVVNRLLAVLPPWFGIAPTPNLDSILNGFAALGNLNYSQMIYVQNQTRVTTATDNNLDLIAVDFFGPTGLLRNSGETDLSYRARILANLLSEKVTRRGMSLTLFNLTGHLPRIFEPQRPADSGGYSSGGCGYGAAGGWSNPGVPYQCFIIVYTPTFSAVGSVAGWNIDTGAWSQPGSNLVWLTGGDLVSAPLAAEIYAAINACKAEGTTCWVQFQNA